MTATPAMRSPAVPTWFDSPGCVTLLRVGDEGQPVVVIDGASGDARALVEIAASRTTFAPAATVGSSYPGILGAAPVAYLDAMVRFVLPLIEAHFDTGPVVPARARGNFSLVTTPPHALAAEQCGPHVDTADSLQFATVHFLSTQNRDGTGFFRHRRTGFETIDAGRADAYRLIRDEELANATPPAYQLDSDALFDLIGTVDARFDRLVLYRASLLHSGMISRVPAEAADPALGRLTGNLFLQCRPRS